MTSAKDKTTIGLFVIGAVAIIVMSVFLLGSGTLFKTSSTLVLYFEGNVAGLGVGAPVVFRGVEIGQVKKIDIEVSTSPLKFMIPVYVEIPDQAILISGGEKKGNISQVLGIDREKVFEKLINFGARGSLTQKSFVTGELQVMLDFHPDTEARFYGDGTYPEIPTITTGIQKFAQTLEKLPLEDMAERLASILNGLDKLVNSEQLQATPEDLDDLIKTAKEAVVHVDENMVPVLVALRGTVDKYGTVADHLDEQVVPLSDEAQDVLHKLSETLDQAKITLSQIERSTGPKSATVVELRRAISDVSAMAKSIKRLSDMLERRPEALIQGKGTRR